MGGQAVVGHDFLQLPVQILRPGGLGHFHQDILAALDCQVGENIRVAHAPEEIHLRPQPDVRQADAIPHGPAQPIGRFLPVFQKSLRPVMVGVEMGGGDDPVDALGRLHFQQGEGFLHRLAPIVNAGQNVAVPIYLDAHCFFPALFSGLFSAFSAFFSAFLLRAAAAS